MNLDEGSLALLHLLRGNSRSSLTNISKKSGIPVSTLFDKLRVLENKLIQKHTIITNFKSLGYKYHAKFFICLKNGGLIKLKEKLKSMKNINTIIETQGDFDLLVDAYFENQKDFEEFNEVLQLYSATDRDNFFITKDIVKEYFLSPDLTHEFQVDLKLSFEDMQFINILRKNARTPISKISEKLGVPVSTLHVRYSKLKKYAIVKHTSLIDWNKIGFDYHVFLQVRSNNIDYLLSVLDDKVNSISCIKSQENEYLTELILKDFEEYRDVLKIIRLNNSDITKKLKVKDYVLHESLCL